MTDLPVRHICSRPLKLHSRLNVITSAKEVMFSSLFFCSSVSNFAQKLPNGFAWNFQGRLTMNKWLKFGGDPDHGSGTDPDRHENSCALAEVYTVPVLQVNIFGQTLTIKCCCDIVVGWQEGYPANEKLYDLFPELEEKPREPAFPGSPGKRPLKWMMAIKCY